MFLHIQETRPTCQEKKRKETRPVVATKLEGRSIALRRPVYIRGINAIMQNLFRRTKAILGISRLQEHSSMTRFQCSRIAVDNNEHFGFFVGASTIILYRNRQI